MMSAHSGRNRMLSRVVRTTLLSIVALPLCALVVTLL